MTSSNPNKVALVTGGARRIGAAIVKRVHQCGFDVAIHCNASRADADALAASLNALRHRSAHVLQADLAHFDRLPELIAQTIGRFDRLDALINNASGFFPTPLGTATPAQWDSLFASNARAPFFLAQAAAAHLRATRGAIVNLIDIHAERPLRDHGLYVMAKGALLAGTRALALDLAPEVRVNAVSPGAILWPEDDDDIPRRDALLARTPLARTGTDDEVAEAVRWLVQDATYCTGVVIDVDGGRSVVG